MQGIEVVTDGDRREVCIGRVSADDLDKWFQKDEAESLATDNVSQVEAVLEEGD